METDTLILGFGLVVFLYLVIVESIAYQRQKSSVDRLAIRVKQAEEELKADTLQSDKAELMKTKSGREFLKLMEEGSESVAPTKKIIIPDTQTQHKYSSSSFIKWVFAGIFASILIGGLLGINISNATWLNSGISSAEAQRTNIEVTYQQETYELQKQMSQAQTEAEIQEIQRQQEMLDAQRMHDLLILNQDIANRQRWADILIQTVSVLSIGTGILLVISIFTLVAAKAIAVMRSAPKNAAIATYYEKRLEQQEELIKNYEEQLRMWHNGEKIQ